MSVVVVVATKQEPPAGRMMSCGLAGRRLRKDVQPWKATLCIIC